MLCCVPPTVYVGTDRTVIDNDDDNDDDDDDSDNEDDDDDEHNRDDDVTCTIVYQRKFPFSCAFQTWAKWTLIYCVACKSKFYLKVTKKIFVCLSKRTTTTIVFKLCVHDDVTFYVFGCLFHEIPRSCRSS